MLAQEALGQQFAPQVPEAVKCRLRKCQSNLNHAQSLNRHLVAWQEFWIDSVGDLIVKLMPEENTEIDISLTMDYVAIGDISGEHSTFPRYLGSIGLPDRVVAIHTADLFASYDDYSPSFRQIELGTTMHLIVRLFSQRFSKFERLQRPLFYHRMIRDCF
jgi:hypothetical protein